MLMFKMGRDSNVIIDNQMPLKIQFVPIKTLQSLHAKFMVINENLK